MLDNKIDVKKIKTTYNLELSEYQLFCAVVQSISKEPGQLVTPTKHNDAFTYCIRRTWVCSAWPIHATRSDPMH